jgi:hypothetical protein
MAQNKRGADHEVTIAAVGVVMEVAAAEAGRFDGDLNFGVTWRGD